MLCRLQGKKTAVRNNPATPKVREEGRGEGAPDTGAKMPLQPMEENSSRTEFPCNG